MSHISFSVAKALTEYQSKKSYDGFLLIVPIPTISFVDYC